MNYELSLPRSCNFLRNFTNSLQTTTTTDALWETFNGKKIYDQTIKKSSSHIIVKNYFKMTYIYRKLKESPDVSAYISCLLKMHIFCVRTVTQVTQHRWKTNKRSRHGRHIEKERFQILYIFIYQERKIEFCLGRMYAISFAPSTVTESFEHRLVYNCYWIATQL